MKKAKPDNELTGSKVFSRALGFCPHLARDYQVSRGELPWGRRQGIPESVDYAGVRRPNEYGSSLANRKPHPRVLRARFARFFLLVGKLREAVNSLGSLVVLVRSGVSILAILVSNPG